MQVAIIKVKEITDVWYLFIPIVQTARDIVNKTLLI